MAKVFIILLGFILKFLSLKGQTLPEGSTDRTTVCAGTNLLGSCPVGEVIVVKDVQYGTKLTTTCPLSSTTNGCCDYSATDCFDPPYTGTTQQAACSGRSLCNAVAVGEEDTSSCGATYPGLNHYLTMEYYCIPGSRIGPSSSATLQETGKLVYLRNTDYPSPIRASPISISCSVETTVCTSQVSVYFVHFELSDGGGSCTDTQILKIDDDGAVERYTCSHNTDYTINQKLTSTSNYLTITINNPNGISDGKFWLGLKATDNTAPIKLSCPAESQTVCMDCPWLSAPINGQVSPISSVPFGQSATYTCSMGYTLIGDSTRKCQIDGTWSGSKPICGDCPVLTSPNNGAISVTGYTVGDTATYTCSSGYVLTGTATRTCQADSTWSGSEPTCTGRELDDICTVAADCFSVISDSTCESNKCVCNDGYRQQNNVCVAAKSEEADGLSVGVIVGIVVGCIVGIGFIVIITVVLCYLKSDHPTRVDPNNHMIKANGV